MFSQKVFNRIIRKIESQSYQSKIKENIYFMIIEGEINDH